MYHIPWREVLGEGLGQYFFVHFIDHFFFVVSFGPWSPICRDYFGLFSSCIAILKNRTAELRNSTNCTTQHEDKQYFSSIKWVVYPKYPFKSWKMTLKAWSISSIDQIVCRLIWAVITLLSRTPQWSQVCLIKYFVVYGTFAFFFFNSTGIPAFMFWFSQLTTSIQPHNGTSDWFQI